MLQENRKQVRPSLSEGELSGLSYNYRGSVEFFDSVSEEAASLLMDLYNYSPEIRAVVNKKGRPDVKFESFRFTADISFGDDGEAFFEFSLFAEEAGRSAWVLKNEYWDGDNGWRLTFDFNEAGNDLKAIVSDIEAFENDEVHEDVSIEAFDLIKTALSCMIES